jgi:hypothetical protein
MADPGPMKKILHVSAPSEFKSFVKNLLQVFFGWRQPFLPPNCACDTVISHWSPRTFLTLIENLWWDDALVTQRDAEGPVWRNCQTQN